MINFLRALIDTVTWSVKPRWVSPPLRNTKLSRGKHLKRVWINPQLSRPTTERIYLGLGGIDISNIRDRRDESRMLSTFRAREVNAETCRQFLAVCLDLPAFDDLTRRPSHGRLLRLDLAITDMSPGIAFLRTFEWWTLYGLGHAYVQIEGIVSEPSRASELLKFVARRRHSGLGTREDWWLLPEDLGLPEDLANTMIGELIGRIAYDLVKELDAQFIKGTATTH